MGQHFFYLISPLVPSNSTVMFICTQGLFSSFVFFFRWKMSREPLKAEYPPISVAFMPAIASTSGRLDSEFIRLLFLQAHRETDRFFAASGVQPAQSNRGTFHFNHTVFLGQLKTKIVSSLAKASALRVNLNIDGAPITSRSHTHSSHSQVSHLLTSSLSLGVPVPHTTECIRVM